MSHECTRPAEASAFVRFQLEELLGAGDDLDEQARLMICDLIGGLRCLGLADRDIGWRLRYGDARSVQELIDDGLREEDYGEIKLDALVFFQLDRVVDYLERVGRKRAKSVCGYGLRIVARTPPGVGVE